MALLQYVLIYSGQERKFFEGDEFDFSPFYSKEVEVPAHYENYKNFITNKPHGKSPRGYMEDFIDFVSNKFAH